MMTLVPQFTTDRMVKEYTAEILPGKITPRLPFPFL